jgi:4-amino-4-deoxy-L-arabinose transferase-like glycosyltransferase
VAGTETAQEHGLKRGSGVLTRGRTEVFLLVALLLLGAALRTAFLREAVGAPDFTVPLIDAGFHDYWARGLAFGQWDPRPGYESPGIRSSPYFRPPGYPYFLAGVYRLFGPGYLAPRILQALLGLLSGLCAWFIARRIGGPVAGLCTLFLMMVYWPFIYFEGELHTPALQMFLTLTMMATLMLWTERPRTPLLVLAGALLGIAALVRPEVMLFAPLAAAWIAWAGRGQGRRPHLSAGAFLLAFVAAIAPATARNYFVAGEFVPISANGGINLYIGNNEQATGFVAQQIDGYGFWGDCFDYPALKRNVEKEMGRRISDSEVSRFFSQKSLAYVRSHPADFVRLTLKKALLWFSPHEYGHNKADPLERANSRVLSALPIGFSFVFVLAIFGACFLLCASASSTSAEDSGTRARQRLWGVLLLLFLFASLLALLPFFVAGRYRVPLIPFLAVFAGCALARLFEMLRGGQRLRGGILALAALALVVGHLASPVLLPVLRYEPSVAAWHHYRAVALELGKNYEAAEAEYRRALAVKEDFWEGHYNLGRMLLLLGRPEEGLSHFEAARRLQPFNYLAYEQSGVALKRLGRFAEGDRYLAIAREMQEGH